MAEWVFKVFKEKNKISDFVQWYKALSYDVQARLDQIIRYMEITKDWTQTGYFRPLKGYKEICEIIFTISNIQYRPLGYKGPLNKTFTFLVGATKSGGSFKRHGKFEPRNAPELAMKRKGIILNNEENVDDFWKSIQKKID